MIFHGVVLSFTTSLIGNTVVHIEYIKIKPSCVLRKSQYKVFIFPPLQTMRDICKTWVQQGAVQALPGCRRFQQMQGGVGPWTKKLQRSQSLNVVFTGYFCLGWCCDFVGSESGQKQSVKPLQNVVYNTTQHLKFPTPHSHTLSVYTVLYIYFGTVGGHREGRGPKVHKYSSFFHGGNSSQGGGSKIQTMSECISSL